MLIYGEPVHMVEKAQDVDRLLSEWHHGFRLRGLVATLPWLIHPIVSVSGLKPILMPRKGHSTGSGHIMSVRLRITPTSFAPYFVGRLNENRFQVHEKLFQHRLQSPHLAKPGNLFDRYVNIFHVL